MKRCGRKMGEMGKWWTLCSALCPKRQLTADRKPTSSPSAQPDDGAQQKTTLKFLAESQDTTAGGEAGPAFACPLGARPLDGQAQRGVEKCQWLLQLWNIGEIFGGKGKNSERERANFFRWPK